MASPLGRAPSTIMRKIAHNGVVRRCVGRYRARYRFGARRAGWDVKSGYSATAIPDRNHCCNQTLKPPG